MASDRVLVAYGSRFDGTAEIAEWICDDLRAAGLDVGVRPAGSVSDIERYGAVVLGGGLYAGRWHRDARWFARHHARVLRDRPVWCFSSGPLDGSAEASAIPPVRSVARAMARVRARGHETFGGRLESDAPGLVAGSMSKRLSGDFRDRDHVRRWAGAIAHELLAVRETSAAST
jgi:menaquinone-dependent protoporphyrinogen oxidase